MFSAFDSMALLRILAMAGRSSSIVVNQAFSTAVNWQTARLRWDIAGNSRAPESVFINDTNGPGAFKHENAPASGTSSRSA